MRTLAKAALLTRILQAVSKRARVYLRDPKKMQDLMTDAQVRADAAERAGTMASTTLGYLGTMGRMAKAVATRQYRTIPWGTALGATAAVLYFVMPLDFIPDILVGMGLVDDAALIAFVATRIKGDLEKFTAWERARKAGQIRPEPRTVEGQAIAIETGDESVNDSLQSGAVTAFAAGYQPGAMGDIPTRDAILDGGILVEESAEGGEPDARPETIEQAAEAILDAVEEAQAAREADGATGEQPGIVEQATEASRKAAKQAEKAAKAAAKEAEKEAKKAAKRNKLE
jgi:uncharacterized membrane protein YkvA (DUF1232 family)